MEKKAIYATAKPKLHHQPGRARGNGPTRGNDVNKAEPKRKSSKGPNGEKYRIAASTFKRQRVNSQEKAKNGEMNGKKKNKKNCIIATSLNFCTPHIYVHCFLVFMRPSEKRQERKLAGCHFVDH